jgi:molybdenum cofactor biosynthesis protein B
MHPVSETNDGVGKPGKAAAAALRLAVVTVSDTRTPATDRGGDLAARLCADAGFEVAVRALVPDDEPAIRERVRSLLADAGIDAVLVTGGTGVAPRDRTVEAVLPLLERRLDGYGELFRMLSFADIGAAAMLSRAVGGVAGGVALFTMPGSPAGVRLALEKLILPQLRHVLGELRRPVAAPAAAEHHRDKHDHHDEHGRHGHHHDEGGGGHC